MQKTETIKLLTYFEEFKNIIQIFGETEIGCSEVDIEKLAEYMCSFKFHTDIFSCQTTEEIQNHITNLILDGFPLWEYLKISDWTKDMVSKSFKAECHEEFEEMKKQFCCLNCDFYSIKETMIGLLQECKCDEADNRRPFELRKKCEYYKLKEN